MNSDLQRPQRLHALTLFYRLLVSLPGYVLILYGGFGQEQQGGWATILFLIVYAIFTVPWAVVYYLRFRYRIDADHVTIVQGILTRQDRSLPTERIQNVEIQQNLVQRLLGLASVRLETAGSHAVDGQLDFVDTARAREIRSVIRAYQRGERAGSGAGRRSSAEPGAVADVSGSSPGERGLEGADEDPAGAPEPTIERGDYERSADAGTASAFDRERTAGTREPAARPGPEEYEEVLYEMGLRDVLLRGLFRFSLVYILLFFSALEYLNVDLEQWLTQRGLEPVWETIGQSPVLAATVSFAVAVLLSWLTGVALTLNRYFDFRLTLEGDKLHEHRGLFTTVRGTIPTEKLQAYLLRSNVLMRAFGWYTLEIQAMGLQSEFQGRQVAAPLISLTDAEQLLRRLHPVGLEGDYRHVSPLTIRRKLVRYTVGLAVVSGVGWWFWSPAAGWAFAVWPLLAALALLQYRHHRYRFDEETGTFVIRSGVMRHRIWMVPASSLQVLTETESIFQRRLDLASIQLDTAGGAETNYPEVVDLREEKARRLLENLYGRFREAIAGTNG